MDVSLVDYGAGNLASVIKALRIVGAEVTVAAEPGALNHARAIVIPGVGHFESTRALDDQWREEVRARIAAGAAVLGICLGMQWLFDGSEEAPDLPGLGVFPGRIVRFREKTSGVFFGVKVPHVGWNTLDRTPAPSRWLTGIPSGGYAYFTHSYAAPVTPDTVATTTHGLTFASVVERGRVCGAQWHPEKSGDTGLSLLERFIAIAGEDA